MLDDDNQNVALGVLAGVVALVVAGVIAIATWGGDDAGVPLVPAVQQAVDNVESVYFDVDSATLPDDAVTALTRAASLARQTGAMVLISGFHDASGDAAHNAELAKERAMTVRHALEADGVAPDHLLLARPEVTNGGGDARDARRVEIRLQ